MSNPTLLPASSELVEVLKQQLIEAPGCALEIGRLILANHELEILKEKLKSGHLARKHHSLKIREAVIDADKQTARMGAASALRYRVHRVEQYLLKHFEECGLKKCPNARTIRKILLSI